MRRTVSANARPAPELWQMHEPVLAFGRQGRGTVRIVYVHGLGARWQVFKPVMTGLQEYAQLALDLRGHGLSGREGKDYSVATMAGDLIDFLVEHCSEPVVLVGHSLGGWIAMVVASTRADLVDGLVVIDSPLHSSTPDPLITRSYLAGAPLVLRAVSRSPEQLDPVVLDAYRAGKFRPVCSAEYLLGSFPGPIALFQGDQNHGALMSDEDVRRIRRIRPDLHHVFFEGTAHAVQVQDSQRVVRELKSFLEPAAAEDNKPVTKNRRKHP